MRGVSKKVYSSNLRVCMDCRVLALVNPCNQDQRGILLQSSTEYAKEFPIDHASSWDN